MLHHLSIPTNAKTSQKLGLDHKYKRLKARRISGYSNEANCPSSVHSAASQMSILMCGSNFNCDLSEDGNQ